MWIVSRDKLFARALQITLAQAGLTKPRLTETMPETAYSPLVVDLDSFERPRATRLVTFSSVSEKNADFTRPFLMREFAALCKARFTPELSAAPVAQKTAALRVSDGKVLLNGRTVALTPGEEALLQLLLARAGECVPKAELDRLWKGQGNMTEVYIRYLRKKLDEPSGLRLIRTVRGKGYILCLPNDTP